MDAWQVMTPDFIKRGALVTVYSPPSAYVRRIQPPVHQQQVGFLELSESNSENYHPNI
jgi:hypothetical protein